MPSIVPSLLVRENWRSCGSKSPLSSAWRMIVTGTITTHIILVVLAIFSLVSWGLILWKALLFRKLWRQAGGFMERIETAERLEDAYRNVLSLPESPFTRVFRRGIGVGQAFRDRIAADPRIAALRWVAA